MNITFIGSGYVGLVSGIMMSHIGHNVICLDTDQEKISQLQKGIIPIYEPGLVDYLDSNKLKFRDNYGEELLDADAVFITVGTPPLPSGAANLQYIFEVIDNICQWIKKDCIIIIKSTVPPTTCNKIIKYLADKNFKYSVASNPEFLREGSAVYDFLHPDRIIIGTNNKVAEEVLNQIYLPLIKQNIPIISTDLITAELIKYASNAFLATKIAFTNEMANLCEKIGANIQELCVGVGSDTRIGREFLTAGPGFGGSCFPKDILALSNLAKNYKSDCKIVDAVIESNQQRPLDMVNKIINIVGNNKTITLLGLTFKAETDDVRSSPALKIVELLIESGYIIQAFDPVGMVNAAEHIKNDNIIYRNTAIEACNNSVAIIITTEWSEFKELNWDLIYTRVKFPVIIDLRNLLDDKTMQAKGFKYYSIGKLHCSN